LRSNVAVTAWHVIHDAQRVEARRADHQPIRIVGLIAKDEAHDLALLKLETPLPRPIPLSAHPPPIGARVYVIGAPRGLDFSLSDGLVSQIRTVDGVQYFQISSPISPGHSGGPVLDASGQVVGVVSWRKAGAENVGFAVPIAELAHLDSTQPVTPWPLSVVVSHPPDRSTAGTTPVRAVVPASPMEQDDGFRAFQNHLAHLAGKPVNVVVKAADGEERRFSFAVPASAAATTADGKAGERRTASPRPDGVH
jgi:hypothetical protein